MFRRSRTSIKIFMINSSKTCSGQKGNHDPQVINEKNKAWGGQMTCPEKVAGPDLIPSSPVPYPVQSCILKTSTSCFQSPPLLDPSTAIRDHEAALSPSGWISKIQLNTGQCPVSVHLLPPLDCELPEHMILSYILAPSPSLLAPYRESG